MAFWLLLFIYVLLIYTAFRKFYIFLSQNIFFLSLAAFYGFVCGYLTFILYYLSTCFPCPNLIQAVFLGFSYWYTLPWPWIVLYLTPMSLIDTPLMGMFYFSDIIGLIITFWFYYFLVFSLWTLIYKIRKRMESKATLE